MKTAKKILTIILILALVWAVVYLVLGKDLLDIGLLTGEPSATEQEFEPGTSDEQDPPPIEQQEDPVIEEPEENVENEPEADAIDKDGYYTSKEDVALYIHTYGRLPSNFITKAEAGDLGWSGGGLDDYAEGFCIGGDKFGNYEGILPEKNGRKYTECDIDTMGKSKRGAKRIVFSNDGLIYYTDDHYESFELLYGQE